MKGLTQLKNQLIAAEASSPVAAVEAVAANPSPNVGQVGFAIGVRRPTNGDSAESSSNQPGAHLHRASSARGLSIGRRTTDPKPVEEGLGKNDDGFKARTEERSAEAVARLRQEHERKRREEEDEATRRKLEEEEKRQAEEEERKRKAEEEEKKRQEAEEAERHKRQEEQDRLKEEEKKSKDAEEEKRKREEEEALEKERKKKAEEEENERKRLQKEKEEEEERKAKEQENEEQEVRRQRGGQSSASPPLPVQLPSSDSVETTQQPPGERKKKKTTNLYLFSFPLKR